MDSWTNFSRLWAVGVVPSCPVPGPRVRRAKEYCLQRCKSEIEEVVFDTGSGLVSLLVKGVLGGKLLSQGISKTRQELSFPCPQGAKMSKHHTIHIIRNTSNISNKLTHPTEIYLHQVMKEGRHNDSRRLWSSHGPLSSLGWVTAVSSLLLCLLFSMRYSQGCYMTQVRSHCSSVYHLQWLPTTHRLVPKLPYAGHNYSVSFLDLNHAFVSMPCAHRISPPLHTQYSQLR